MPVRSKSKSGSSAGKRERTASPSLPAPTLSQEEVLRSSVLVNRLRASVGKTLDEFFTFVPTACFTCRREMPANKLSVGVDLFVRCTDTSSCRKARGIGAPDPKEQPQSESPLTTPPGEPSTGAPKKPKFKSKSASVIKGSTK